MKKLLAGAIASLCFTAAAACADNYPAGPITLYQGYAPGGSADTIARLVAQPLSEALGVPVVVEPKPGAGGNLAANAVARAKPDGYTIGLITGGHAVARGLYRSLPFDPVKDFKPITNIVDYNFVLAVPANSPYKTLEDLIAQARTAPGSVSFGSAGVGTTHHLTGELLASRAGISLRHIPYRGEGAAITSVLGGEIPLIIASPVTIEPQIKAGKLRALAVTSDRRWSGLPDTPTVAEAGVKDFNVATWAGLVAPDNTPDEVISRLHDEVTKLLDKPDIRSRIEAAVGGEVHTSTPAAMRERIASESERWVQVVKDAGIAQQ